MTDARPTPEDQVLKHFRDNTPGEPPAHLDAFILAAAHREAPAVKPSLWQKWLRACQQPRWQVAFASLVGVALMLTLVQRAPVPQATYDFAPEPKAAVKTEAARAPAPVARSLSAPAGEMAAPVPAAPMADFAAPHQEALSTERAEAFDEAKTSKKSAARVAPSLDDQLREVLRLRAANQGPAADALLKSLRQRYPGENLDVRLKQVAKP